MEHGVRLPSDQTKETMPRARDVYEMTQTHLSLSFSTMNYAQLAYTRTHTTQAYKLCH